MSARNRRARQLSRQSQNITAPLPSPRRAPTDSVKTLERYGPLGRETFSYRAADVAAQDGRWYSGGMADWHGRYQRLDLINQARTFKRDNPIYVTYNRSLVQNVLGPDGMTIQAKTPDEDINELIEKVLLPEFLKAPEVRGVLGWRALQELALNEMFNAGDVGAVLLQSGQCQLVESERIKSPGADSATMEQGVEMNASGRPIRYWLAAPDSMGSSYSVNGVLPVDASYFVFHAMTDRINQVRGIPASVPILPRIHQIEDIISTVTVACQLQSRYVMAITRDSAASIAYAEGNVDPITGQTMPNSGSVKQSYTQDGTIFHFENPNDKVTPIDQTQPNPDVIPFLKFLIRTCGSSIGLPLEVLLQDWTETTYSGGKGGLQQAGTTIAAWHSRLACFLNPIIRHYLRVQQAYGFLPEGEAFTDVELVPPPLPWMSEEEQIKAAELRLDRGLTTHTREAKAQGFDRSELMDEMQTEIKDAITRSQKIKDETGVDVPYERFCGAMSGKTALAADKAAGGKDSGGNETPSTPGEGDQPPAADGQPAEGQAPTTPGGQPVEVTQETVLNGAQIVAATGIVQAVADGLLPRDSGIGQLMIMFNLSKEKAEQIMGSVGSGFKPTKPEPAPSASPFQPAQKKEGAKDGK